MAAGFDKGAYRAAVAAELQAARARAGLTQDDLASRTGFHRATINRWLGALRAIPVDDLATIADAMGTSAAEVLDGAERQLLKQQARMDPDA